MDVPPDFHDVCAVGKDGTERLVIRIRDTMNWLQLISAMRWLGFRFDDPGKVVAIDKSTRQMNRFSSNPDARPVCGQGREWLVTQLLENSPVHFNAPGEHQGQRH